ncbi:hypothetical protein, partial [Xanthomonas campestris]
AGTVRRQLPYTTSQQRSTLQPRALSVITGTDDGGRSNLTNAEIMHIGHFDEWLETLDYWGDELFRDQIRRSTWLATYMLTNGTSPVPIIVAANSSGLMHPKGATMRSNQLIEGHMRLAYLRGMIRQNHTSLRQSHLVWLLSLPNSPFNY